jgi:uncharacterized membrane protein YdjX (TVP38/TMEM64 family)
MPADYSSTAKALALPISPMDSPSPENQSTRPPWSRRISNSSRRAQANSPYSLSGSRDSQSYKSQILHSARKVQRKVIKAFLALSLVQRILAIIVIILLNVVFVLFLIYNERIFGYLAPAAEKWRDVRGGWTILWALTFISAFPPLIGYSTTVTISGFVYGFPKGWFIVSTATVVGSLASFIASRTILSQYVHRLVGQDKRFEALALTLKHDGLKILCMIRVCPLPYSLSNAAMSTFPTVHPLSFALATAIASPKLLIHVFIGNRLALLAESGGKMDASTKAINYASIIIGGIIGTAVGYIIYQRTMARSRELEIAELEAGNLSPEEAAAVRGDLRREYSDLDGIGEEEELDLDAAALMNDDDISLWDNERVERLGNGYRDEFTDDEEGLSKGDRGNEARKPPPISKD